MTQQHHLGSLMKWFALIVTFLIFVFFVLRTASRDHSSTYTRMYSATGMGATPKESRADVQAKIRSFVEEYDDSTEGVVTKVKQEPESWNDLEVTIRFRMLIDRSRSSKSE